MKSEFDREIEEIERNGLKSNPLRLEYEKKVRELDKLKEIYLKKGMPVDEIAGILYSKRRELGKIYKNAAPPLFREYIFYATKNKYGDPLGPDYETLKKNKSPKEIMESAVRPIKNLDDRITQEGFIEWYNETYGK